MFFVILNHPSQTEDRRSNISYSPLTKLPPDIHLNLSKDLNLKLSILKYGLDIFLRSINDLTKSGPDRPISGSSPHIIIV